MCVLRRLAGVCSFSAYRLDTFFAACCSRVMCAIVAFSPAFARSVTSTAGEGSRRPDDQQRFSSFCSLSLRVAEPAHDELPAALDSRAYPHLRSTRRITPADAFQKSDLVSVTGQSQIVASMFAEFHLNTAFQRSSLPLHLLALFNLGDAAFVFHPAATQRSPRQYWTTPVRHLTGHGQNN